MAQRVTRPAYRYPSQCRLRREGAPFSFLERPAVKHLRGTRRTRAYRPPHVPPQQPRKRQIGWKRGLRANCGEEKTELWIGWRGNAQVISVEFLLALKQQFLHGTESFEHGERRVGVSGGFGEAGALQERFKAVLGSPASCQCRTARMHTLEVPNEFHGPTHLINLVPLLVLGRVPQIHCRPCDGS